MQHSPAQPSVAVTTSGLALHYGATPILKGIDLSLARGQTLALLGPSGCGKTTLLRLVAGLLTPTSGRVTIDGNIVADAQAGTFAPPEKRGLGMVFQDYALWPHMSVHGNVSFPLEMRGVAKTERDRRVAAALERVGLGMLADRRPSDMSGGQQQRVAIARAIVAEPQLVLFDEPLSNLDRELRENMVREIAHLVATLGLTAIYVTHDQSEAFSLADQVAVMRAGIIEQMAPPDVLIDQPATPYVADFLRLGCVAPVEKGGDTFRIKGTDIRLDEAGGRVPDAVTHVLLPSKSVTLGDIPGAAIIGTVCHSQFRGDGHLTVVRFGPDADPLEIQLMSTVRYRAGDRVGLHFARQHLRWFSTSGN